MLLRSNSSPLLTSATASSSSPAGDMLPATTAVSPIRATNTHRPHLSFTPIDNNNKNKIITGKAALAATSSSYKLSRTLSDGNFSVVSMDQRQQQQSKTLRLTREFRQPEEESCCTVAEQEIAAATLVMGDGCAGGGGIKICKGRGGDDSDSSDPHRNSEISYQRMIDADPANSLILGNYARFLKDVRGDVAKAKEMCERAIVAANSSDDAGVLCFYAEMIWESTKDVRRAETYFDRAVKAAPHDCYVMASYAHFLWESEEQDQEEEEEEEEQKVQQEVEDENERKLFENWENRSQFVSAIAAAS